MAGGVVELEVFGLLFAPSERWGVSEATQRQSEAMAEFRRILPDIAAAMQSYGELHDDKKESRGGRAWKMRGA
ncbi:MAG: hypothetical protein PHQ80_03255 [Candidatus ainarchaeum sp.]|nr:hypothetical protein [Candidatus ainarchaeum sp.]